MAQMKLGELLVRAKVLQESQVKAALAEQHRWGGKLGETLVRMGLVTEDLLILALSRQLGLPTVPLEGVEEVPASVKAKIPADTAREMCVLPLQLRDDGRTLVVVMSDPLNLQVQDDLQALTGCRLQVGLAGRTAILRALARIYSGQAVPEAGADPMRVVDAQGRPMLEAPELVRAGAAPPAGARPAVASGAPTTGATGNASELLHAVEDLQRREATALKAMVELLIEKGAFTRDEFLVKVRR